MIEIKNCIFDVQGASKKDTVYGITLNGNEDILIENCTFSNKGYSSILNEATAQVTVKDCVFNCENVHNPIEGSQSVDNGGLIVENCEFKNAPGNNYINFYQFKEGAKNTIKGCSFEPLIEGNVVRVSNRNSHGADFLFEDCRYVYPTGAVATNYTGFLLCQDYTNKSGITQDFKKCTVTFLNVVRDGVLLDEASEHVFYVYEDGKGVITGQGNDPVVIYK